MAEDSKNTDKVEETTTETTTVDPEETSATLDPEGTDALGVKKNVVGPIHDDAPADNSPTTDDVHGDLAKNIEDARNEGYKNGLADQNQVTGSDTQPEVK